MAARNNSKSSKGEPNGAPAQHHSGIAGALEDLEVSDDLHPLLQFIVDHIKPLAAGLVVFLLVIAGYGIWEYTQGQAMTKASNELGTILAQPAGEERIAALEQFLKSAPGELKEGVRLELASELADAGQYERAAEAWQTVGKDQGQTFQVISSIGRAQSLMQDGKSKEALQVLEDALAMAGESFYVPLNRMIANAAEESGNYARAVDALKKIAASDESRPQMYLKDKIARLEAQMNKES